MKDVIYLDYNATAPAYPAVAELVSRLLATPYNASSVHATGREGRRLIDTARRQVATLSGADQNNVIFNSGATEGNNTVLKYFSGETILVSAIEHPSVLEAAPHAPRIPVTAQGIVDLGALDTLLQQHRPALVSCQLVNNETGIIQPIRAISDLAQKHGAWLHCDAVQAAGRIPLAINELGIHFMTISSHKIGGPQGVGALILGQCGITPTLLDGGGQEKKARAGTENVAGIAGFGRAAELALAAAQNPHESVNALLEKNLLADYPAITIYGRAEPRVKNTTFFSLAGASSETLMMALDLEGICASNGSACSSGTVKPSHVLKAMGASDLEAASAIRLSTGWNTSAADIDAFLHAFRKIMLRF